MTSLAANQHATMTRDMTRRGGGAAEGKRQSFGEVLRDLLIARGYVTAIGNPNWMQFSHELDGIQYESLRKAITRERDPSPKIMEAVAEQLGVEPTVFWEYRLWSVQRKFDPREVGEDEAYENLRRWLEEK